MGSDVQPTDHQDMRPGAPRVVRGALAVIAVGIVLYALRALTGAGGDDAGAFMVTKPYWVLKGAALLLLAARVVVRPGQRVAWATLALGFGFGLAGDLFWASLYGGDDALPPVPSPADLLYVAAYPAFGLGTVLLLRDGGPRRSARSGLWLDGLIVTLTLLAGLGHFVLAPLVRTWPGQELAAVLTNAAYPVGDAVLLAAVVGALAMRGWHLDLRWAALAGAFASFVLADAFYLVQLADGTYAGGSLVDCGWLVAGWLAAAAAWTRVPEDAELATTTVAEGAVPTIAGGVGIALLAWGTITQPSRYVALPACAVAALIFVRFALTSRDNRRLTAMHYADAITDALTGLGNRRKLLQDLDRAAPHGRVLVLFDLDGFKAYNDTFGHPAGDALLQRIGDVLADEVEDRGTAYRLGGDEFCALVDLDDALPDAVGRQLSEAMAQVGSGFRVGASFGTLAIAPGAAPPAGALGIADQRLYACKHARRAGADRQSADVLLAVLAERAPELNDRVSAVADLAGAVAERLQLPDGEAAHVRHAAALHDIGTMAIPDAVLAKAGPLDEAEWALMRQHTVIGERILGAAPALGPVAALVRATHERWDGGGYPDGRAGEEIPLGARIVFACDAFDAMVAERPYAPARELDDALAEIERCAGTQFDPVVAAALVATVRASTRVAVPVAP